MAQTICIGISYDALFNSDHTYREEFLMFFHVHSMNHWGYSVASDNEPHMPRRRFRVNSFFDHSDDSSGHPVKYEIEFHPDDEEIATEFALRFS